MSICTHACMCANNHAMFWGMKHDMENDMLIVFFVELGKWEMRLVNMRDAPS
jgi:hypothetical protein